MTDRSEEVRRRRHRSVVAPGALLFLSLAVVALGARCSGDGLPLRSSGAGGKIVQHGTGGGAGGDCGPPPPPSGECASAWPLVNGGIQCSDVLQGVICAQGMWVCPSGTVPFSECTCFQDCSGTGGHSGTGGREGIGGSPPPGTGGSLDAGTGCDGPAAFCLKTMPTPNGGVICGDVAYPGSCTNGAWVCPAGTVPISQCNCYGPPPGTACSCTPSGWSCPDGGNPGTGGEGPVNPGTGGSGGVMSCVYMPCPTGLCLTIKSATDASSTTVQQVCILPPPTGCDCQCLCAKFCGAPSSGVMCSCDDALTAVTCTSGV